MLDLAIIFDTDGAIQIHWLVYTFPWHQSQYGVFVTLMWRVALCSGLATLSCGLKSFEEFFQDLRNK